MPAKINLLNQQFGKLLVIEETNKRKNKSVVWKCQCECGNIIECTTKNLRSDGIIQCPNCGTNRQPQTSLLENLIGKTFNHLTVLEKTNRLSGGKIVYKCKCDCGNPDFVYTTRTDLISGHTRSCGCAKFKYSVGEIVNNRQILKLSGINEHKGNHHHWYRVKCLLCGKEYDSLSQSLEHSVSCGCQNSIGEYIINKLLIDNKLDYQAEYVFSDLPTKRFDFVIFNNGQISRVIEFDGEQHYPENIKNSGWNTIEHYNRVVESDQIKNNYCKTNNIPLVRIPYWERDKITLDMIMGDQYEVRKPAQPTV